MSQLLRAKLNLINLSAAYKACFCDDDGELTKQGARVLRDLGHFGCVDRTILHRAPVSMQIDPLLSMAAEGRRDVVRRVWRYIKLDPNTHPMMQQKDDYE